MGVLATLRGPTLIRGGRISNAAMMLAAESQGLAIDFTDLSMAIKDTATPANTFSGNPNSKLTYSSPSTKWILGANGLYQSGTTIRTEFTSASVALGVSLEDARTNVVLHNRDLTNVVWTKTNITAAKDQTGIDGVENSASSLTATAGNGTCLQAITLGSSARYQSAFVKRITGSGTINMTMDNGTTWTVISPTASWTPLEIPTQTLANPTVGFRIVTSGDAIAIDMVGNENGTFRTSPIATTTASVTRAADLIKIQDSLFNLSDTAGTLYAKILKTSAALTGFSRVVQLNNADAGDFTDMYLSNASVVAQADGLTVDAGNYAITAGVSNKIAIAFQSGAQSAKVNSNAVVSTANAFTVALDRLQLGNSAGAAQFLNGHLQQVLYLPRKMTDGELGVLTA